LYATVKIYLVFSGFARGKQKSREQGAESSWKRCEELSGNWCFLGELGSFRVGFDFGGLTKWLFGAKYKVGGSRKSRIREDGRSDLSGGPCFPTTAFFMLE